MDVRGGTVGVKQNIAAGNTTEREMIEEMGETEEIAQIEHHDQTETDK